MGLNFTKRQKWIVAVLFILSFAVMLTRTEMIHMGDEAGGRSFMRGDDYSDMNAYSSARYFHDHGFWETRFRAVHSYAGPGTESQAYPYTHYPSGPDLVTGVWSVITDSVNESTLRLYAIFLSVFFFFFIFYFLKRWLPDPRAAFIGACIIVSSNYFIAWGDNIHKHLFEELFKWTFVHLLLVYFHSRKPVYLLGVLFVFAAVVANFSFEPITFLAFCTVGFSIVYDKSWRKLFGPLNWVVAFGFIAGFGLHMYLNALAMHGWPQALADMKEAFLVRTNQCTGVECNMTLMNYLELPLTFVNRMERFFMIPGFAVLTFFYFAARKWKRENPEALQIAWVLLAASFSWFMVMSQHAKVHSFTGKQSGLFIAWVVGTGILAYLPLLQKHWREKNVGYLTLHFVFVLYIVGMALTQQVGELYWTYGFARLF